MPVDKSIADASLLAEILLQKYEYHVPFYRQIQQYRHLGMKGLTLSTMDGWFKKTVELLKPLYELLKLEVFTRRRPICRWSVPCWPPARRTMSTRGIT